MNKFYSLKFELKDHQWEEINRNPSAVFLLEDNPDKICWRRLSENSNAMHLLKANPDKINWYKLGNNTNPLAIEMLDKNIDKEEISWHYISYNPSAVVLFEKYKDKLILFNVARNDNKKSVDFLKKNPELIDWPSLCQSINDTTELFRTEFYEKNKHEINWSWFFMHSPNLEIIKENFHKYNHSHHLSRNEHDHVIEWLSKEYPNKIEWSTLSMNRSKVAIKLIEENIDKIYNQISWHSLSENPSAINLIEKYFDKTELKKLLKKSNNIDLLEEYEEDYMYEIHFDALLENPNAIDLLNKNIDRVIELNSNYCDYNICVNPNCLSVIIKYHYEDIKNHFYYNSFGKELIEWIYNPKNMDKWSKNCWDLDL